MKILIGLVALAFVAFAQEETRSVWDGVYTEEQAHRGQPLYNLHCASCHADTLTGGEMSPPLAGGEFLSNWNGLTIGDLFERIRTTMPMNKAGKLSRDVNADVTAYILSANRFPAGKTELPRSTEMLKQIRIAGEKQSPYRTVENWAKLPEGRTWGSTSAVAVDSKGHIWIAERCGANSCAGKTVDPILEFDESGNLLKSFGSGMLIFPHGFWIDKDDNVWVTDGQGRDGKGHQVFKFGPDGKVLMTLGKAGIAGEGPDTFNQPNAVAIAPNGDIFVSDGHNRGTGNARVVKLTKDGKFIKQWGGHGSGPGQFEVPHTLAFDSKGRLFVGDRANNRIQIFDQDGDFIAEWKQFGRPSGVFIDSHDVLYVADSESIETGGYAGNNPGFKRGIRIGSAKDGTMTAFIPDPSPGIGATSAAEGVTADANGNVYGAEVTLKDVKKYVRQ